MITTSIAKVTGLEQVLFNLRKRKDEIGAGVSTGLRLAGQFLLRESQGLVPVEYGTLRDSGFVKVKGTGYGTTVNVGYTAPYALFVHENVEQVLRGQPRPSGRGRYWEPGRPKFLEEPARRLQPELRAIIRAAAMIRA